MSEGPWGLTPYMSLSDQGFYEGVKDLWDYSDFFLVGFKALTLLYSDATLWGADEDGSSYVAHLELDLDGQSSEACFSQNAENSFELELSENESFAILSAITSLVDLRTESGFSSAAKPVDDRLGKLAKMPWLAPSIVWVQYSQPFGGKLARRDYLFDLDEHPEFQESWLDAPGEFLEELREGASRFFEKLKPHLAKNNVYVGPRVRPLWMKDYLPKR